MAFHLYSVLVVAIVAVCVNNCYALTDEQKTAIKEKLKANAVECGMKHSFTIDQMKQWKEDKKAPDDTNKCFFACMFKKSALMNDQGLFDESVTLEKIKPYLSDARKDEVNAAVKACTSVNEKSVSDGAEGCDRAVLLFNCLREQKELLGIAVE